MDPRPMVWYSHLRNIGPYDQAINSLKHFIFRTPKMVGWKTFSFPNLGAKKSLSFHGLSEFQGGIREGILYCMCMVDFFLNICPTKLQFPFSTCSFPRFTGCIYYDRPVRPWDMLIQSNIIQPATSYRKTWNQQLNKRWYFILLRNSTRMCKKYIHSFGISIRRILWYASQLLRISKIHVQRKDKEQPN